MKEFLMRKKSAWIAGVLAGMASPSAIYTQSSYPRLQGSDLSRLRNDVRRVGGDFHNVISREYGKSKKSAGT